MKADILHPVAVAAEAGKVLHAGLRHKLTEGQTGGAIYVFESEFGPGDGNKLHVHRYEDELAYVLEGALEVQLVDHQLNLTAGGIAYLPKNIPHALRNPLGIPSKYLFAAIPGGYIEHWFEAVQAAREGGVLDDAAYRELSLKHGIEWLE